MDRRTFLTTVAGCGAASVVGCAPSPVTREVAAPAYFGLHPFIEAHPEAVFIRKTGVTSRTDADAKKHEGSGLAQQIFTLRDTPGIPLTHKFAIKPNLTMTSGTGLEHAIVTDPFVVEGLIESMKQMGIAAESIYVREALQLDQPGIGYSEMAERTGVHYTDDDSRDPITKECPDGFVFKRTKYLGPCLYPDTYLINVAKHKTHNMGLTLCVKNLQGTNIKPYIQFCADPQDEIREDFQEDAESHVDDLYAKHKKAGIPRWDVEDARRIEMWAHRTVDSYMLLKPTVGLNIIEGVYAQNGNAFTRGPGPGGKPEIFLTNMFIFGKDAFSVDIIGHHLAGHEPGNFGFFHIGRERGASTALDPRNIPVYLWEDSGPKLTPLDNLTRTPLSTPYLAKPGEAEYHLCNEPFEYTSEPVSAALSGDDKPGIQVLGHWRPARASSSLVIEYSLSTDGYASVDLYNAAGERVGILNQGWMTRGIHVATWNTGHAASGTYYCTLRADGARQARSINLVG
jgi:uncharacterized protein (DUF362 family)